MAKRAKEVKEAVSNLGDGKAVASFLSKIAKSTGGEIASKNTVKYYVDTGNLAMNWSCSGRFIKGGIPGGRITEIYGPSASGKSLIAANTLAGVQKLGGYAIYLDVENSLNPEWMARSSHVNVDQLIHFPIMVIPCLEDAFHKMYKVTQAIRAEDKTAPILFVYDSISSSMCRREMMETELPDNYTAADFKRIVKRNEQPGERAKAISKEMRKLNKEIAQYDATCVIINQVRMGDFGSYTGPKEVTPGGKAVEFYSSLRFRTQGKKRIDNKKLGTIVGVNSQVKNTKNRTCSPFRIAENVKLLFDDGINPISGLLSALVQSERVVPAKKAGTYNVVPAYLPSDKESYTFSGNKEVNDVPLDLLLECPKLVDAESREEVEEYLSHFGDFLVKFSNQDLTETVMEGADAEFEEGGEATLEEVLEMENFGDGSDDGDEEN